MTRITLTAALILATATACGTAQTKARERPTAEGNRRATQAEAQRLLGLTPVPSGAVRTSPRPALVDGPALGTPATTSLVDDHEYWQVDRPADQVLAWLRSHRPRGLKDAGSTMDSVKGVTTIEGLGWSEPDRTYATGLRLTVTVAPVGNDSVIRADGMGVWLDPRPLPQAHGGTRIRVTVRGGCPDSDRSAVGVTNPGSDLQRQLLPDARPTRALRCEFVGPSLVRSQRLNASGALRLANEYRQLPVAHADGVVTDCPADVGWIDIVAFHYAGRPDVDLWDHASGCATVSNGSIVVNGTVGVRAN